MDVETGAQAAAFPITPPIGKDGSLPTGYPFSESGLTKRELFAAMAMQGLLSYHGDNESWKFISEGSVRYADHLLAALSEPQA